MCSTSIIQAARAKTARLLTTIAFCALTAGTVGCNSPVVMTSLFNGLLNPSEVGSYGLFGREGTLDIRSSLSLQDAPTGIMGVSDPQPEDLVPIVEEYEYQIADVLTIRVFELLQRGTETAVQVAIDETGCISLPVLGRIEIVGLTLPEVEAELIDQIVQRGILVDPEVIVEPAVRRQLSYTIYGTIAQPNLYPLGQYNLRLLDAINVAGGLVDSVTQIYVVRSPELPEAVIVSRPVARDRLAVRPSSGELTMSGGYGAGAGGSASVSSSEPPEPATPTTEAARQELIEAMTGEPTTAQATTTIAPTPATPSVPQWIYRNGEWVEVEAESGEDEALEPSPTIETPAATQEAREELIKTMTGEPSTSAPTTTTAIQAEPVPSTPSQPRWIYYNGEWIETESPTSVPYEPTTLPPVAAPTPPATEPSIDWSQIAGLSEQRVIKISAGALRDGDPRHNIVVRPGDAIRLTSGEFGEYYVMGQVVRPGAYSLTGRMLTLKTAIASAGNLGQLAWPTHCTVYRRLGDREQMIQVNLDAIFAGKEQDFFLKKDDLILVGTHPVATFLAVLRNAFRVSYGFGFVYDRNFADIDSFGGQPNPAYARDRFPNLFPQQR